MRYYEWSDSTKPSARPLILTAILALVILIANRYDGLARELSTMIGIVTVAVVVAYVIPQLISWYISMIVQHYAAIRETQLLSSDLARLNAQERLLDQYEEIVRYIGGLDNEHLKAILAIPTPAELDLMPAGGEFLVLPSSGERAPMTIIREIAERWIQMVNRGRNPYYLPPVRLWSGRTREIVRAVYLDLAQAGLVVVRDAQADQPWRGNMTATVALRRSPVDVLRYLRLENEFYLEESDEQPEPANDLESDN